MTNNYVMETLERDGYKCMDCGDTKGLVVHHIDGSRKSGELNNDSKNLRTLCRACHAKEHGFLMTDRNFQLYEDFESGNFTVVDLVVKYRISSARIYQIARKVEKKSKLLEVVPSLENEETI